MKNKLALFIIIPLVLLLGLFLVLRITRNAGGDYAAGNLLYENPQVFETWDDYLSSDQRGSLEQSKRRQVVFIGMDGATWNIMNPMIEAGELPTFKMIMKKGSFGVLRSLQCFISPPAWVTMMTGCMPEKSGVYTFGKWNDENNKFNTVSSEDVRVPSVWDIASIAGLKVAVTNIPITYPAEKVNGLMVAGELTPITLEEKRTVFGIKLGRYNESVIRSAGVKTYSPVLAGRAKLYDNMIMVALYDPMDDGKANYSAGVIGVIPKRAFEAGSKKVTYYDFQPDNYSPWLSVDFKKDDKVKEAWLQIKVGTEKLPFCKVHVSPVFIAADDPDVMNTYPESFRKIIKKEFKYYFPYTPFDKDQIPSFAEEATECAKFFYGYDDWDLFLYAFLGPDRMQHREGFSDKTRRVYRIIDGFLADLLERMPEDAILVVASDHGFKSYEYSIDMNSYLAGLGLLKWSEGREINYDSTLVHYNMYCVFFNDKLLSEEELAKRGISVEAGESPKSALKRYLKQKGKEFKDPKTRRAMPVEFVSLPEEAENRAPDMFLIGGYTDYNVELWDYKNPHKGLVRLLKEDEKWKHKRDGVFFLYGKGIRKGYDAGIEDIQDIAPTLMYALNLPVSHYIDGRVIENVFSPKYVKEHPLFMVKKYAEIAKGSKIPDEEREAIEKKLKSLGYIR